MPIENQNKTREQKVSIRLEATIRGLLGRSVRANNKEYEIKVQPKTTYKELLERLGLSQFSARFFIDNCSCSYDSAENLDPVFKEDELAVFADYLSDVRTRYIIEIPDTGIKDYKLAVKTLEAQLNRLEEKNDT